MTYAPRVSIGMPVYNGARFLTQALDSILAQSFENFELIISDNATTDRTEEICRGYAARDKRVKYLCNETNIGVYRNFNRVFALAAGEYFKWASADDFCHRDLVAKCIDILDRDRNIILAYPRTTFVDDNGKALNLTDPGWHLTTDVPHDRIRYVIQSAHWVNAFYGLIRAESLAKTRLFPPYNSGDYRLLGELSLLGKFYELPDSLFYRRIHQDSSSQIHSLEWQKSFFKGNRGHTLMPLWHLCFDHSVTIIRSQLRVDKKLSLVASVLNRMRSAKRQLLAELITASKAQLGALFPFKNP
jgi:glycosyltransferase involved in cell wall biosynthesis